MSNIYEGMCMQCAQAAHLSFFTNILLLSQAHLSKNVYIEKETANTLDRLAWIINSLSSFSQPSQSAIIFN